MRRFIHSGGLFMLVALVCFAAALMSERSGVFMGIGSFWLVYAIIVRSRYNKRTESAGPSSSDSI